MEVSQMMLLQLLLIAAAVNGFPTTSNPQGSNGLIEPRVQPPVHGAVVDKQVYPSAPRDGAAGSIECTMDSNCTSVMGEDAICLGSTCACQSPAMLSSISNKCLRESSLGSGCAEDWQCTKPLGNSVSCKDHICTCTSDASLVNGKCWKQKRLSDECQAAEECLQGHDTLCEDSRCACKPGLVPRPTNDKCLPKATKFGDTCDEAIQCTEAFGSQGVCKNGKCVCQDGYHFKNHKCMKDLILGDTCGTGIDGDCFLIHSLGVDHIVCVDSKCQCKDNLIPSADNQRCLAQGQPDPGSGGGAESVQPLLITFMVILFARLISS